MIRRHAHVVIEDFGALDVVQGAEGVAVERRTALAVGRWIRKLDCPGVGLLLAARPSLATDASFTILYFDSELHAVPNVWLPRIGDQLFYAFLGFPGHQTQVLLVAIQ